MLHAFFIPRPVRSEQLSVSPTSFQLRQNLLFLQQLLCLNLAQAFHHFSGSDTRGWWWLKWIPPTKFWLVLFFYFFCNTRLVWITDKAKLWVGLAPGFFLFLLNICLRLVCTSWLCVFLVWFSRLKILNFDGSDGWLSGPCCVPLGLHVSST